MPAFDPEQFLDLLTFARSHGVTTVVDVVIPQNPTFSTDIRPLLGAIDYFLPNDDEALALTGESDPLDQLRCFAAWGANTVLITLGKRGVLAGRANTTWQAGIYPVDPVDPSGSGDSFGAGVIAGILRGWEMPRTLRYASALGASAARAVGTTDGVFTAEEAAQFIASHQLEIRRGNI
jgi:sugar/nucleoside kinase (ribokinase family)